MGKEPRFEYVLGMCIFGIIFGVFFCWIFTASYLPDFYPMVAHGLYMLGMTIITIIVIVGYIKIDKDHWLVFSSLWLFVMGLWVMFAYAIYAAINVFISWWRSNLSFNTGLILMFFAVVVLILWASREFYYKRMENFG